MFDWFLDALLVSTRGWRLWFNQGGDIQRTENVLKIFRHCVRDFLISSQFTPEEWTPFLKLNVWTRLIQLLRIILPHWFKSQWRSNDQNSKENKQYTGVFLQQMQFPKPEFRILPCNYFNYFDYGCTSRFLYLKQKSGKEASESATQIYLFSFGLTPTWLNNEENHSLQNRFQLFEWIYTNLYRWQV